MECININLVYNYKCILIKKKIKYIVVNVGG